MVQFLQASEFLPEITKSRRGSAGTVLPAVTPDSSEVKAVAQGEVVSLFQTFLGYVMSNEEYYALKNFLDLATAWGQGIEANGLDLFWAFVVIQKYFRTIPM